MLNLGNFLIFCGFVSIAIGFFAPTLISGDDRGGFIAVLAGAAIIALGLVIKKTSLSLSRKKGRLDLKTAGQSEIGHPTVRTGHGQEMDAPSRKETIAEARMNPGYSYARDKLTAHIGGLDHEQKTMNILDDIIGVIDEYVYSLRITTVSSWNFLELAQYVADNKHLGFQKMRQIEHETKIMRPLLAGLKVLVLVADCGIPKENIPNKVSEILKIDGPAEVDNVIQYLLSRFK